MKQELDVLSNMGSLLSVHTSSTVKSRDYNPYLTTNCFFYDKSSDIIPQIHENHLTLCALQGVDPILLDENGKEQGSALDYLEDKKVRAAEGRLDKVDLFKDGEFDLEKLKNPPYEYEKLFWLGRFIEKLR